MTERLRRTFALTLLIATGLLGAACGGGAGSGNAATQEAAPAGNQAQAGTASKGGGGSDTPPVSVGPQQVEMGDDMFKPAVLTITAGTEVTWINKGEKAHTVVSADKLFDSGLVQAGGQFSYRFTTPGTYSIRCSPHPKMIGRVIVR